MGPELIVSAVVMGLAAPLVAAIKSWVGRKPNFAIKVGSRNVTLDLDRNLQPEQVTAIVGNVVRSASQGDEAGLQKAISDSHTASEQARQSAA